MSTLYRNGSVYSPVDPFATAMLVVGDRIAWIGQEGAAATHVDSVDTVVDLDGALVTAAFVDSHVHLTQTGLAGEGIDLSAARSAQDVLTAIAAAPVSGGATLVGQGFDESRWNDPTLPTLAAIDQAAAGRTVFLARIDGHSSLVSSALLDRRPAIAADPGHTDGFVRGEAHRLARLALLEEMDAGEVQRLQRAALCEAAALGIASVHENAAPHINGFADAQAAAAFAAAGEALPEVVLYWGRAGAEGIAEAKDLGARGVAGDLILDGSIGSRTARFFQPYADSSGRGLLFLDEVAAAEHLIACTKAGLTGGFHCIGDEAVAVAVAALRAAEQECGAAAVQRARHRLEHVEAVTTEQIEVLSALGVVASVQPSFDAAWGGPSGMYVQRLGLQRAEALNPFAALARSGVTLALGSDSPVTPMGGWESVRAAATHHTPQHRLSVRGAFMAATRGGHRAAGTDDSGVLAPGMRADYVLWEVPGELLVQAADERVSAWSTDPASGVPPLPDLSPGAELPRARQTVRAGTTIYAADT